MSGQEGQPSTQPLGPDLSPRPSGESVPSRQISSKAVSFAGTQSDRSDDAVVWKGELNTTHTAEVPQYLLPECQYQLDSKLMYPPPIFKRPRGGWSGNEKVDYIQSVATHGADQYGNAGGNLLANGFADAQWQDRLAERNVEGWATNALTPGMILVPRKDLPWEVRTDPIQGPQPEHEAERLDLQQRLAKQRLADQIGVARDTAGHSQRTDTQQLPANLETPSGPVALDQAHQLTRDLGFLPDPDSASLSQVSTNVNFPAVPPPSIASGREQQQASDSAEEQATDIVQQQASDSTQQQAAAPQVAPQPVTPPPVTPPPRPSTPPPESSPFEAPSTPPPSSSAAGSNSPRAEQKRSPVSKFFGKLKKNKGAESGASSSGGVRK